MEYEILTRSLKDSAAHSKLKLLKEGEIFGVEKPGGEKRIHIGSMTEENRWDRFFFPNGGQTFNVIVSKIDLIKYLFEAKDEYFNPKQSYRLKISDYYNSLYEQTKNIPLESFQICFEKNTDNSRYYLTRPSNNESSKNYKYIIDICLPIVTEYVFIRVKDDNSYLFYLKPEFRPNYITNDVITPDVTKKDSESKSSRQQIFYGAPGTGKSHKIKDDVDVKVADEKNLVFRTTFHPDSDYSTFVGCYKPITSKSGIRGKQPILDYDSLVDKFKEYLNIPNVNITKACTLFGFDYHDSIIRIQENGRKVMDLVNDAYKSNTSYDSVVRGGMACYEQNPIQENDSKITYSFIPQAFLQAYVAAWNNPDDKVFLVIEEINRGNCAQIFGDLFQLLDRDDEGVSEYPIMADKDLAKYLNGNDEEGRPVLTNKDGIKDDKLRLPKNLYIWATMNTSDQSLFPIDSAFKRRWDWEYMPIGYKNDNWIIKIGEKKYKWGDFQRKINDKIYSVDNSEDKQLGDYFVNADRTGNEISSDTLLNKILFYLWNDVCKDDPDIIFKWVDDKDDNKEKSIKFSEFFREEKERKLQGFMAFLGIDLIDEGEETNEQNDDNSDKEGKRFSYNGTIASLREIAASVVSDYAKTNSEMNAQQVRDYFMETFNGIGIAHIVEIESEYRQRDGQSSQQRTVTPVTIPNGEIIYVSTQWRAGKESDNFYQFMKIVNEKGLGTINSL